MTQIANPNSGGPPYLPPPASITLQPGIVESVLTTLLTTDVKGNGYAIPHMQGVGSGRNISWKTIQLGGPSVVNVVLEVAQSDVDADYVQLDLSTNIAGEVRQVAAVLSNWIRARSTARTGGTSTEVRITVT